MDEHVAVGRRPFLSFATAGGSGWLIELSDCPTHAPSHTLAPPFLPTYLPTYPRIQDTCGIHNLHGMPGLLGGVLSVIAALVISPSAYGGDIHAIVGVIGCLLPYRDRLAVFNNRCCPIQTFEFIRHSTTPAATTAPGARLSPRRSSSSLPSSSPCVSAPRHNTRQNASI
jgi:hypothetical protein